MFSCSAANPTFELVSGSFLDLTEKLNLLGWFWRVKEILGFCFWLKGCLKNGVLGEMEWEIVGIEKVVVDIVVVVGRLVEYV